MNIYSIIYGSKINNEPRLSSLRPRPVCCVGVGVSNLVQLNSAKNSCQLAGIMSTLIETLIPPRIPQPFLNVSDKEISEFNK